MMKILIVILCAIGLTGCITTQQSYFHPISKYGEVRHSACGDNIGPEEELRIKLEEDAEIALIIGEYNNRVALQVFFYLYPFSYFDSSDILWKYPRIEALVNNESRTIGTISEFKKLDAPLSFGFGRTRKLPVLMFRDKNPLEPPITKYFGVVKFDEKFESVSSIVIKNLPFTVNQKELVLKNIKFVKKTGEFKYSFSC